MKVLSETERRLKNIMMEKRTVLQTRLNDLGASRISAEVTAARSEVEHRLKELEKAFTRMEAGRYGICETCTTEIAQDRLEAVPETPFCRDCA